MVQKMKFSVLLLFVGTVLISCSKLNHSEQRCDSSVAPYEGYALMPVPASLEKGEGVCRIDRNFDISLNVPNGVRTNDAVQRFITRLDERTALFLSHEPARERGDLHIICNRKGETKPGEDEGYHLRISPGVIELSAETDLGTLYGLETLFQLLKADENGYYFPCLVIDDQPRFTWRGLMIDVSRHFLSPETIKRNIDGMAAVKMNVLHLHLSDDQGFRVETRTCPGLFMKGSDGLYYTQEQVKDLIRYADDRGIRIVPEFDMPGHTTSWFPGYPELAVFPGVYGIEREFGIFDCVMDPSRETTYSLLDRFISEMSKLFPDSYFHIGGDENNGVQWDSSLTIQAFKKAHGINSNHELQAYFNERVNRILLKNNKKMAGWEEIASKKLPDDIVIQSWRGEESLVDAVKEGFSVILSRGYYIDLMFPAADHYLVDPVPSDSTLTDEQRARILGGEATMWSEYVTMENVDSRIWPRTAAIAERYWSPAEVRDVEDMYARLDLISLELEGLGLTHIINQDMMLRRLCVGEDTRALKVLVGAIEPLNEYQRWGNFKEEHGYTLNQLSPYTRVMDVAVSDAGPARLFTRATAHYLAGDKEAVKGMRVQLESWKANDAAMQNLIKRNPALQEVSTLSTDLASIAVVGLEAIDYLEKGKTPSAEWLDQSRDKIEKARLPRGQTCLMVTDAISRLLAASDTASGS